MARLWAKTVSFDSISVGDQLPILVKSETQDSIERSASVLSPFHPTGASGPHPGETPAGPGAVGCTMTPGPALVAYVAELLEKAFPITAIVAQGSHLEVQATGQVHSGDTVTLSGQVVSKREEGDRRLVECEVIVENQHGETVARAVALVPL